MVSAKHFTMRYLRITFIVFFLLLCYSVSAQIHHYQYSHDAAGNMTSRTYQANAGAKNGSAERADTLKVEEPGNGFQDNAEEDSLSSFLWQAYKQIDTSNYGPLMKTQAEKDAYDSLMMAEVMALAPIPSLLEDAGEPNRAADPQDYSVGEIPLACGLSPSGARTYSVPIFTAPDIKYAPSISLAYNSQGGYGCGGYGWDIAGLSSITLTNKTTYWDGEIKSADSSGRDGVFCLDGVRLVTNDDPATSASYPLVTATGHILVAPHRDLSGYITTFTALYPDGTTAVYGIQNIDNQFTFPIYPVTRTTNTIGEKIEYTYIFFNGGWNNNACPVLSSVRYGFNASGVATAEINLTYTSDSGNAVAYVAGRKLSRKSTVASIASSSGGTALYSYSLSYESPTSLGASLLKSISLTNSSGESLPPLTFIYGYDNDPPVGNGQLQLSDSIALPEALCQIPSTAAASSSAGSTTTGLWATPASALIPRWE